MTKLELVEILEKLEIPISESIPEDNEIEEEIRICYWDYVWEPIVASDTEYNTNVTYQISVIADRPRHPKLLELKKVLNGNNIFPRIQIEHLQETRRVHSFFSMEVLENIE